MVEGTGFENRRRVKPTGGSNPSPSANPHSQWGSLASEPDLAQGESPLATASLEGSPGTIPALPTYTGFVPTKIGRWVVYKSVCDKCRQGGVTASLDTSDGTTFPRSSVGSLLRSSFRVA